MNAQAAELGLQRHALRPARRARRAGRVLERRRRHEARATARCAPVRPRDRRARRPTRSPAGATLHTWDDLLSRAPATYRRQDGPHERGGLVPGCGRRAAGGVTVYATLLGVADARRAQRRPRVAARLGPGAVPRRPAGPDRAHLRDASSSRTASAPLALVAAKPLLAVARLGRPLTETVIAPRVVSLPVRRGTVLGRVEIRAGGRLVGTRDLVASRTINKPGLPGRLGWYAGRTLHHLAHLF